MMIYPAEFPNEKYSSLKHPVTLVEGKRYVAVEQAVGRRSCLQTITFVDYTTCPAVVVIANGCGIRSRCLRDELLEFDQTAAPDQDEGGVR